MIDRNSTYPIHLLDYDLPQELIAQEPLEERGASRMLHLDRAASSITHRRFADLPELLREGDVLVINDSKVIPGRIRGRKLSGGAVEILVLKELPDRRFKVLTEVRGGLKLGNEYLLDNDLLVRVEAVRGMGIGVITAVSQLPDGYDGDDFTLDALEPLDQLDDAGFVERFYRCGQMPTPPYIKRKLVSPDRYQTVYACARGSAAAPTAGLHFTADALAAIADNGVEIHKVTLHVGIGTFLPIRGDDLAKLKMHKEEYRVEVAAASAIARARRDRRRVIAVGTTSARTLETLFHPDNLDESGNPVRLAGESDLFIYPGYEWRAVGAMLTNFHLPRSTLLAMIFAFAGRDFALKAYGEAIAQRYRFYSFGDCMFVE
jgi:S-adenosylmethionine:tRNA ribosyltransferase-isomerase